MKAAKRRGFSPAVITALRDGKYLRIRAGDSHRFLAIWMVLAGDRLFVRSWTLKPDGWNAAFRQNPVGSILVGERELRVRARAVRGERILAAVDRAYREKYTTRASTPYAIGLAKGARRASTLELIPA